MTAAMFDADLYVTDDQGDPIEACLTGDPEVMFPDEKLPNDHPDVLRAKRECLSCFFRDACLNYALERNELWGVWGGKTAKERAAMQRKHRRYNAVQDETLWEAV